MHIKNTILIMMLKIYSIVKRKLLLKSLTILALLTVASCSDKNSNGQNNIQRNDSLVSMTQTIQEQDFIKPEDKSLSGKTERTPKNEDFLDSWIKETYYDSLVANYIQKINSSFGVLRSEGVDCSSFLNVRILRNDRSGFYELNTLNCMDDEIGVEGFISMDTLKFRRAYEEDTITAYFDSSMVNLIIDGEVFIRRYNLFTRVLKGDYVVTDSTGTVVDTLTIDITGKTGSKFFHQLRIPDYDDISMEYWVDHIIEGTDLLYLEPNNLYYEMLRTSSGFRLFNARTDWDFVSVEENPNYKFWPGFHYEFVRINP